MEKRSLAKSFEKWWFVIFLAGYAMISVGFQVLYPYFSYWPTFVTNEIVLDPCYSMRVRFPLSVPILYASQGSQAKQVTFWVWQTSDSCIDEVMISFSSSQDIIWLDQKRDEVGPSLKVQTGETENSTSRYSLYIYTPVQPTPSNKIPLKIFLNNQFVDDISLQGQSQIGAILFGFLYILFGTPSLTMVVGALATGFGIFQTYKNLETMRLQRQRELEADMEHLKQVSGRDAADIGLQYSSLMGRVEKMGFGGDDAVRSAAERVFKTKQDEYSGARIWAFSFRKEISQRLTDPNFKKWLDATNKQIKFLNDDELQTMYYLSADNKNRISYDGLLDYGLKAFSILGVDNVEALCNVIAYAITQIINEKDAEKMRSALKDRWFANGASGRYLCQKLASVENLNSRFIHELPAKLMEWENEKEYPPNLIGKNASLWTSEPLYLLSLSAENFLKLHFSKHIQWRTPFGPIKAEFDPRLPRGLVENNLAETDQRRRPTMGFFCEDHPIWEQVISTQSLCISAEHGMGSTALILMGRHVRRFWGSKPSLSMYLQLYGNADEKTFWSMMEHALFEQLIRDLVEDPFWLLNAPISSQQMIASFLIIQAGDFAALLRIIDEAGLPEKEREMVGLALFEVSNVTIYLSYLQFAELIKAIMRAMLDAARPRIKDNQFYAFTWVEFKDATNMDGWMDLIERVGLGSFTVLKLFAPAPLYSMKIRSSLPVEILSWEREQLKGMIVKRIKQTGKLNVEDFPLDELVDKSNGSPARLIEAGNQYEYTGE